MGLAGSGTCTLSTRERIEKGQEKELKEGRNSLSFECGYMIAICIQCAVYMYCSASAS